MLKKRLLACCLLFSQLLLAQEYLYNNQVFINSAMEGDYFFSHTIQSGNSAIKNVRGKLPVSKKIFHTPGNALELNYNSASGGNWEATIYKLEKRGMDHFKTSNILSFWLLNASAIMKPDALPAIRLIRKDSSFSAPLKYAASGGKNWEQIIINAGAENSVDIIGINFFQNSSGAGSYTIYIDDIEWLSAPADKIISTIPVIKSATGYAMHVDITWPSISDTNVHLVKIYRSTNGKNYTAVGVQQPYINRFADITGNTKAGKKYLYKIAYLNNKYAESNLSTAVGTTTKPMTDDELLTMVQEASFRYYWEAAESYSGLAKENISGRQNMIASGASGFGIMALIVGTERKFITWQQAVERFVKIVNFLEKAETFHGAFAHFIDGPTGKVEPFFGNRDNGADLVETSFLLQGLLAARQYFSNNNTEEKLIREKITSIWQKVEWDWFKQYAGSKFLYWHWSPDQGWVINHNLIGWNETMVTYLLAIASPTHPVPASMYYSGWANQDSTGQQYRSAWGQTKDGSMYTNGSSYFGIKLDVGVSNGGPLFFTHYSYMGYDPHFITDKYTNYFTNNKNIAKINHAYCVQNPKHFKGYGDSAWGLTASDGPFDYSADEPVPWQDHGKIAPTGAISSFPYLPNEAMKALKNYYFNYGKFLWGEYGFKDAFDVTNNWCSEIYMGLNQAPMTVMIENYRTGLIWKLFMSNPEIKIGLERIKMEGQ